MRKYLGILFLTTCFYGSVNAIFSTYPINNNAKKTTITMHTKKYKNSMVEASFRYFKPSSCVLQEIYGKNWIDYQVKFCRSLLPKNDSWHRLHMWFAINYAGNSGKSINGLEPTKIQLIPLSFGLKFVQPIATLKEKVEWYLGTGLKYYFMNIRNDSQYVDQCVNRNKLGGVAEAGLYYAVHDNITLNLMMDYSFIHFRCAKKSCIDNVQEFDLKAGGIAIGGGIGFRF